MTNEVAKSFESEESQNLKLSNFTVGKQKDLILELCLKYPKRDAHLDEVKRILFPEAENDDIIYLVKLISDHFPEVLKINEKRFDTYIKSNDKTKGFLQNGGFTKLESELNSESEYIEEKKALDLEVLKIQKENSEYLKSIRTKDEKIKELTIDNLRLGNWDIRFRWYIAIGSFIVGIIVKYFIDK